MTLCAGAVADRCQHRADECPPAKNPNATIGRTLRTSTKREGEQGHEGSGKAETMVGGQPPRNVPVDQCPTSGASPAPNVTVPRSSPFCIKLARLLEAGRFTRNTHFHS
jgi:hypothetical protein